jgi:hypothetical protein
MMIGITKKTTEMLFFLFFKTHFYIAFIILLPKGGDTMRSLQEQSLIESSIHRNQSKNRKRQRMLTVTELYEQTKTAERLEPLFYEEEKEEEIQTHEEVLALFDDLLDEMKKLRD